MSPAGRRTQAGFTLLEVLLVLAIMGMLASIAAPRLGGGVAGLDLSTAARELATDLRRTRSEALVSGRPAALILIAEEARYELRPGAGGGRIPDRVRIEASAAQDTGRPGQAVFRFFPDGAASGGSIRLSRDGRRFDITVDWMTGRVALSEP